MDSDETLLLGACAASGLDDDFAAALDRTDSAARGPEGILLKSDAPPGSFAAYALAPHGTGEDRYFSSVLFTDPKTVNSPNTVFTGVPVGDATLLPSGSYTPHLSVTNFSAKEIHAHVTFARTSGNSPTSQEVASVTIPSGSSRDLVLKDLEGDPALQNSFLVSSDGAPGDLMAKLVSRSDSRLREVELQAKDEHDRANAGGHPWSIEQGTESTLLLFNHSGAAQSFAVSVSGSEVWQKTYQLASMQTKAIGIRELVEDRVRDDQGRMLPKNAQSGELSWLLADASKGTGRLLQSDRAKAMARNFSCGWSGLLCGSTIQNYESTADDGSIIDYATITPITCTSGTPNACSGQQTGTGGTFTDGWFSSNTGIASIANNSSAEPTSYVLGVSPGATSINGRVSSTYCSSGGSGPITVQKPDNIVVANDVTQTVSCGGYITTQSRTITYTIYSGSAPMATSVQIYENVPPTSTTCSVAPVQTGSECRLNDLYAPETVNQFEDHLQTCPVASSPNPCGFSFSNQQWQYCKSDGTKSSIGTVGPVTVLNTKITVNGNSTALPIGTTFK